MDGTLVSPTAKAPKDGAFFMPGVAQKVIRTATII